MGIWEIVFVASASSFMFLTQCYDLAIEGEACTILGGYPLLCYGLIAGVVIGLIGTIVMTYVNMDDD